MMAHGSLSFSSWIGHLKRTLMSTEVVVVGQLKKRTFCKYSYRDVDLNVFLDMSTNDLV
jgi:hypothetical protein